MEVKSFIPSLELYLDWYHGPLSEMQVSTSSGKEMDRAFFDQIYDLYLAGILDLY